MPVAEFLKEHKITRTDLAGVLGLDVSTVAKKTSGERPWKLPEIQATLEYLSKTLKRKIRFDEVFM